VEDRKERGLDFFTDLDGLPQACSGCPQHSEDELPSLL